MRKAVVAFFCGVLFALGLGVGGMTLPSRVVGFLDFFGQWDYSLMFVMGGAIAVYLPVWYLFKCKKSVLAGNLPCAARKDIDVKLFFGASLFGIGWGLAGVCPGPGIVLLARPNAASVVFVAAMLCGMLLHNGIPKPQIKSAPAST
ncbi:MAG: YeeE/YedE family protein [Planctomycetes bacterium]|nr:YeeE/YedE family protein [Planctomycetota bacterium]MCA8945157.1 YeeE/YedE family protein [Planctomycetota bacterium]